MPTRPETNPANETNPASDTNAAQDAVFASPVTEATRERRAVFASTGSRFYPTILALMGLVFVLSNIGASKGVELFGLVTDGGFFLFPLAYILGDVVSEVYGWKASRRAIITTFIFGALAVLTFQAIIALPAASFYEGQEALAATLGPVWQIVLASLLGFMAGQLSNALIIVWLKRRHGERGLLLRILGSSGVGEALDTLIFCSIAAPVIGIDSFGVFLQYFVIGFCWKLGVEVVFSPVKVVVIKLVKRYEPSYPKNNDGAAA